MDFECVQEAADHMMIDVMQTLKAIKPELLIEFRQHYIGPCMRQFGNMFRVSDCPSDTATNRIGMMDLRMLSGNTAVHSDMITWHKDDKPEDAALQVLNTIFGVTQVSKVLSELSEAEMKMLGFWLDFERKNCRVLQQSQLVPYEPQFLYPVIKACDDKEEIIGVYADNKVVTLDPAKRKAQLINACWQTKLTVKIQENASFALNTYDCMGQAIESKTITLAPGLHEIDVPRSGLAILEKA